VIERTPQIVNAVTDEERERLWYRRIKTEIASELGRWHPLTLAENVSGVIRSPNGMILVEAIEVLRSPLNFDLYAPWQAHQLESSQVEGTTSASFSLGSSALAVPTTTFVPSAFATHTCACSRFREPSGVSSVT
jgi:hypothetical protein